MPAEPRRQTPAAPFTSPRPACHQSAAPGPTLLRIWRALRTHDPDERPPGVPRLRYHFPLRWLVGMGRDLLLGRPRLFRDDCVLAVRVLPRPPLVEGIEQVPPAGSFVLVANHYERRDLWIGWSGALLCDALWSTRADLTCHFVTTDRALLDGATVPGTRPLFARVARVWSLIPVTPPEARDATPGDARRALRRCLRALQPADGRSACLVIFPEGLRGSTRGLREPPPGNGRSLLALTATGVPILPAAVWEAPDGALHARFGPLWRPNPAGILPDTLDRWAAHEAMTRIAALLPVGLHGHYTGVAMSRSDTD